MTVLTRGARARRGGRRPGWLLLTVLLVLAIGASSALVLTNRVELLKLAVILALWAAVVAAFVSVLYRRQSDADQAKVRDLKLVYDLQLDREISARREYELSVETHLRRQLASEIRAQAADEVAGLRAELAALRASLEILFDADLSDRPAIEHDRMTVRAVSEWSRGGAATGRVMSSRIDAEERDDPEPHTEESPIIDVPAEPQPAEPAWTSPTAAGGAHRRPSESGPARASSPPPAAPTASPPPVVVRPTAEPPAPPAPAAEPIRQHEPPEPTPAGFPSPVGTPSASTAQRPDASWQPAPAEGQWIPAGTPGSNWTSPAVAGNGASSEYVGRRRAPEPGPAPVDPDRGRHSVGPHAADPGRPAGPAHPGERSQPAPEFAPEPASAAHRDTPVPDDTHGQHAGGQSVAELLARLQTAPAGGGGRRRREQ